MKIKRNSGLSAVLDSVMKEKDPKPEPLLDDNDPLWQLLEKSLLPEPDAWFAVRTLARCRNAGLGMESRSFRTIWHWALGGGLGVCLAILLFVPHTRSQSGSTVPDQQKNVQEAFAIMASMDTSDSSSTSSSSTTTWPDSSL